MDPREFVQSAYASVQRLTDEGDQMHRRAARGRRLAPFVHSTGIVTMRIEGQYVDRGEPWLGEQHPRAPGRAAGEEFAARVRSMLCDMPPPIPGEQHNQPIARLYLFEPGQSPTPDEVRSARATVGWTQAECARRVHYTRPTSWAAVEQGRERMDPARWHLFLLLARLMPLPTR